MSPLISLAILKAAPGQRDALHASLLELIEPTRAEVGNIEYILFEDMNAAGIFYMREAFVDRAAFDQHTASAHFQRFVTQQPRLLAAPIDLIFLERRSP